MIKNTILCVFVLFLVSIPAYAQHPDPQPRPGPSMQTQSSDGKTTFVVTPEGHFPSSDPFENPPGTNFLDTVESNMFDGFGVEMPNTLPSTASNPYNLHPEPIVTDINGTSPTDDLKAAFDQIRDAVGDGDSDDSSGGKKKRRHKNNSHGHHDKKASYQDAVQFAIDILEGNPIPDRVYSGIPMLHYNGPEKVKLVEPIFDGDGNKIGGNVNVYQIWFDSHIESDTAFIDPSEVLDVPWTITYTVDTLNRGHDDFAPMVMYFDDPALTQPNPPLPHVAMDQTFFPMEEGTRTVFEIAMTKGKYYNLTYNWGWRIHPPRVQVSENARKMIQGKSLPQWEVDVFGEAPTSSRKAKRAAISMIGDLSPAKRMWKAMKRLSKKKHSGKGDILKIINRAERAFEDWFDRSRLPDGVELDPNSDVTLFYVNNTIYGQMTGMNGKNQADFPKWRTRGTELKVKLYNGDYYPHAYQSVDFGGSRGWENQFHSTIAVDGDGPWFTFGRHHWWPNAGAPPWGLLITAPPASKIGNHDKVGEHNVHITLNFEPSRRLRIYQFDPTHHDVAIWSFH